MNMHFYDSFLRLNLHNGRENYFTAKPLRTQRTSSKDQIHWFNECRNHAHYISNPCFPFASSRLCGGSIILTALFRFTA